MSGLIDFPPRIWLTVTPVDMRRGLGGLLTIVQQALGHSPCAGPTFIFRNWADNRLRLLLAALFSIFVTSPPRIVFFDTGSMD